MHCFRCPSPLNEVTRALGRHFLRASGATALVAFSAVGVSAGAQPAPTLLEVRPGDTFSGLAAPFVKSVGAWRKMYREDLSGLPNPNRLKVGMRFEVATDASGEKYLRVVPPGAEAATAAAPRVRPPVVAAVAAPVVPASTPVVPASAPAIAGAVPPLSRMDDALVIGVLPYVSATILNQQYEYLKRYLERVDGQKVRIVVPGSFKAFFDNTMNGEYDIAVAAPHFARVAQLDRNMTPLGMYEPRINALFLTPLDSTMTSPRDVREKAVAFANPQSLVAMFGQNWLRQQNMEPGRDYEMKGARSDLGVGRMLLTGEAAAAIMSNGEFRSLPQDESLRLKVMETFTTIPNFVLIAHPRLERERTARLKAHLKAFMADREEGAAFARATNFTAIVEAGEPQLRELDAYVEPTRRLMGVMK